MKYIRIEKMNETDRFISFFSKRGRMIDMPYTTMVYVDIEDYLVSSFLVNGSVYEYRSVWKL